MKGYGHEAKQFFTPVERKISGFGALISQWQSLWGDLADRIGNIVKISVTELNPLTTPPDDDGVSKQEMIAPYRGEFAEPYP